MASVKHFHPGQIRMDLPTANYIYELPLLSVASVYGDLNLSLVFNRQMKEMEQNPYCIADGYKLNLQKRLILEDGIPVQYQDANGNLIELCESSSRYTFDDDSRRIIRATSSGYTLENPDYSLENFDTSGKIITMVNKYGYRLLRFEYYTDGLLASITYSGKPTISLSYLSGKLYRIHYNNFSTTFSYTAGNQLTVNHYSGASYDLVISDAIHFCAEVDGSNDSVSVAPDPETERTMVISYSVAGEVVNTSTYTFSDSIASSSHPSPIVDVTDHLGVKRRMQFQQRKPLFSYELSGDDIDCHNNKCAGSVQIYDFPTETDAIQARGILAYNDADPMTYDGTKQLWSWSASDAGTSAQRGYYVISGWIRKTSSYIAGGNLLYVTGGSDGNVEFSPDIAADNHWTFFSYPLLFNANSFSLVRASTNQVELMDVRISFHRTGVLQDGERSHTTVTEAVLIYDTEDGTTYIPLRDAAFTVDGHTFTSANKVSFQDLLKYKVNLKKEQNAEEFYFYNTQAVYLTGTNSDVTVTYTDADGEEASCSLKDCHLGIWKYTPDGTYITRLNIHPDNPIFAVSETRNDAGVLVSSQNFDSHLDVISATQDGITTTYTRENGLITSEAVSGLYTRSTTYGTNLITETDEFGNQTQYTLDAVWGGVTSVTLPDGTVLTDTYNSDQSALLKRTFGSATGRSNALSYSGGNLSAMTSGTLSYAFTYAQDKLSAITKNTASVEEHVHTDTTTHSYYPAQDSSLYSSLTTYDAYGRVVSVNGRITNSYDLFPSFNEEDGTLAASVNNGNALLAMTTDEVRGETARFVYNENGTLKTKTVADEADFSEVISLETFSYDALKRLTEDACTYTSGKTVTGTIGYVKAVDDPAPDHRVANYDYKIAGDKSCYTMNAYDTFKRLVRKETFLEYDNVTREFTQKFTKRFTYTGTRLTEVTETAPEGIIGKNVYTYDAMGRIATDTYTSIYADDDYRRYTYDQYGQLVREDNKKLAKTYLYCYNEIGNLTSVKAYAYTLSDTLDGEYTEQVYTYSSTYPDQLTDYNGTTIAYNSIGCPTSYDGKTATWSKGRLTKLSQGTTSTGLYTYAYSYNGFGQRTARNYTYFKTISPDQPLVSGELTGISRRYYYDHAGRLLSETCVRTYRGEDSTSESIVYLYDDSGIVGLKYTVGTTSNIYYFQRNLQGDVVAIFDIYGAMVAKYRYDAWGNCIISSETTNYTIAGVNPIRYRGYYYDNDTDLYYCNSRYYSPKWRRFISPESSTLNSSVVNGLNTYVYEDNNPIGPYFRAQKNLVTQPMTHNEPQQVDQTDTQKHVTAPPLHFAVGLLTPESGNMPSWMAAYGLYIRGSLGWGYTLGEGYSLASFSIGVLDVTFYTPKWFDSLPAEHLANPNIFFGFGTWNANVTIGVGGSGTIEILSGTIGIQFGDSICVGVKGYIGIGLAFDLTNGFRFGVGKIFGYEVYLSIDWYELFH